MDDNDYQLSKFQLFSYYFLQILGFKILFLSFGRYYNFLMHLFDYLYVINYDIKYYQ